MKKHLSYLIVPLVSALLSFSGITNTNAQSDSIVWALTTSPGAGVVFPPDVDIVPENVIKGPNLTGIPTPTFGVNGFGTSGSTGGSGKPGWNESDTTNAINDGAFVEFSFSLACGQNFIIDSLLFFTKTSAGNIAIDDSKIKRSVNGGTFTNITPVSSFIINAGTSEVLQKYNLIDIPLLGGDSISFRIYGADIGNTTNVLFIRNFVIKGTKSNGSISATVGPALNICLNQNANISVSNISGGTGPYGVSWDNGGGSCTSVASACSTTVPNVLTSTTYTATITDANGCAATGFQQAVTVNPLPTAGITPSGPITFCAPGTVTLTATPASNVYLWSNGATTQSISVNTSGTFTVTITDANGCTDASSQIVVTENPLPNAVITPGGPTTFCSPGNVILTATPAGASYLWNTGATTQSVTANASGSFTVNVTDANGCTDASSQIVVTENPLPNAVITPGGPTTFCSPGNVILTATPAGAIYSWSTGAVTQSINVTTSGSYSVTVTDANGCSDVSNPTVVVANGLPNVAITPNGPTSFCDPGSVILSANPAGANYLWNNGAITQTITVSASGTFTVTVTDANGCSAISAPLTVTENPLPTANIAPGGPTVFCEPGSVTLTATPANASYLWSDGSSNQSIVVAASGSFTVTVTDVNGCSDVSNQVTVTENPIPNAVITPSGATTFCSPGSVTLTATPINATYLWSNGSNSSSINITLSGNFTVIVTDANGCTDASSSVSVTANTPSIAPTGVVAADTVICTGTALTLNAIGGSEGTNAQIKWYEGGCGTGTSIGSGNTLNVAGSNLVNNGPNPLVKNYFVRIEGTAAPCTPNTTCANLLVTINPRPQVVNYLPDTICSGVPLNDLVATSFSSSFITYSWDAFKKSSDPVSGFKDQNLPAANNLKSDTLINNSFVQSFYVYYRDTLTYTNAGDSCRSFTLDSILVNPAPPIPDIIAFSNSGNNNNQTINFCQGTDFVNFLDLNFVDPSITYLWTSSPASGVIISSPTDSNTVISFPGSGTFTITVQTTSPVISGNCTNDGDSIIVNISANPDTIAELSIIHKDPGDLLIYPDNTIDGYKWGYDSAATRIPSFVNGQVYQAFVPQDRFIINDSLDTGTYHFWVMLHEISGSDTCITKVYYNGPYAPTRQQPSIQVPDEITAGVFPNPSDGNFELVLSGNIYDNVQLQLVNLMGEVVFISNTEKSEPLQRYPLKLPELAKGLYLLNITGSYGEQVVTKVLIK